MYYAELMSQSHRHFWNDPTAGDSEQTSDEPFVIEVNRSSDTLLDDFVQLYRNAPIKMLHSNIVVQFEGEIGVDGGALSREFFALIFQALIDRTIKSRNVFEGKRGSHFSIFCLLLFSKCFILFYVFSFAFS